MKNKLNTSLSLRKLLLSALVAAPLASLPTPLWALPVVTDATSSQPSLTQISQVGSTLQITAPDRTVIRWQYFGSASPNAPGATAPLQTGNIINGETINFSLPSSAAAVLNTVANGTTTIDGAITSNGNVLILNPNGIVVTGNASFSTAGLTLSAISEPDFNFVNYGALGMAETTAKKGDVTFTGAATYQVPSSGGAGNIFLAGKNVNVAGSLKTPGLVTVIARGGAATLGGNGVLNIGTDGTKDVFNVVTPGTGNLDVTGDSVVFGGSNVSVHGGTLTVTSTTTVTQTGGTVLVGDSQNSSTLKITAGSTSAVTLSGLSANGKEVKTTIVSGGATNITTSSGDFTLNASTINGDLTLTNSGASAGNIKSGGTTAVAAGGKISLTVPSGKTATFVGSGDLVFNTLSAAGATGNALTVTSVDGSVTLTNTYSKGSLTVKAQNDIILASGGTLGVEGTGSFNAVTGKVFLAGGPAVAGAYPAFSNHASYTTGAGVATLVVTNAPGGVVFSSPGSTTLGSGTSVIGVSDISATGLQIGKNSGDTVKFSDATKLTATTTGITDKSDNITVLGALTLSAANGDIVLNGATGNGVNLNSTYGAITASAKNVVLFENTSLNLAGVTTTGKLLAYSKSGDVLNTGQLVVGGTTTVGAGTAANPGSISLNYTAAAGSGNQLFGQILVLDNNTLFNASETAIPYANGAVVDYYLAKNLTVVNEPSTYIGALNSIYGQGILGDLSVTSTRATADTIRTVGVTAGGSGYTVVPTITFATPANGVAAQGTVTIDTVGTSPTKGQIIGITITNPGSGYTAAPTFTITPAAADLLTATNPTLAFTLGASGIFLGGTDATAAGKVNAAGKVTLNSVEAINVLADGGVSVYNLTAGGNVNVRSGSDVTVNASLKQGFAGATAKIGSGNTLILGQYTSDYSGATTFSSGNKKVIKDSVPGISIYGNVTFNSNYDITVTQAGHNFGGVTLITNNDRSATFTESGTLRLVGASVGKGSLTLTSSNGSILQDAASTGIIFADNSGANKGTFTAAADVKLTDPTLKNSFKNVPINVTAGGDAIINVALTNLTLGNITTGGALTADTSAGGVVVSAKVSVAGAGYTGPLTLNITAPNVAAGTQAAGTVTVAAGAVTGVTIGTAGIGYTSAPTLTVTDAVGAPAPTTVATFTANVVSPQIVQAAGTKINSYGTTTFKTVNAPITVTNTGNRFGGLVANAGKADIALTELTTMNLKSITTTGNFTATSEGGNVIDSVDADVAKVATNLITVGGTASFNAPKGNISLALGSDFGTVALNASGNASILDSAGNLVFDTSTIGGTFDVTSTAPVVGGVAPQITQIGAINATGATTFLIGNGSVQLGSNANKFGGLRFVVGADSAISEGTSLNLRGNSIATGNVILTTGGDFTASGSGANTFTGDLNIQAVGSITPSAGSLIVLGKLTVNASGTKDLSALSKAGNLSSKDPIYYGTGADGRTDPKLAPTP